MATPRKTSQDDIPIPDGFTALKGRNVGIDGIEYHANPHGILIVPEGKAQELIDTLGFQRTEER